MASNFKISLYKNNGSLLINLMGDFDGSSAFELVNTLKEHKSDSAKIYINADDLSRLSPFGVEVFNKKCPINILHYDLVFTGKHDAEFTLI